MKIIGLLILCLGLSGCYRVFRPAYGELKAGDTTFLNLADCEAFVKKAAEIQPEVKRICVRTWN